MCRPSPMSMPPTHPCLVFSHPCQPFLLSLSFSLSASPPSSRVPSRHRMSSSSAHIPSFDVVGCWTMEIPSAHRCFRRCSIFPTVPPAVSTIAWPPSVPPLRSCRRRSHPHHHCRSLQQRRYHHHCCSSFAAFANRLRPSTSPPSSSRNTVPERRRHPRYTPLAPRPATSAASPSPSPEWHRRTVRSSPTADRGRASRTPARTDRCSWRAER
mmetsp:Transcript_16676/g.35204  ORF Transcript_16676/g.35204 Transcript_16676/m.35204 type:complete len:212 (+) Transcript_16676:113-748(+)